MKENTERVNEAKMHFTTVQMLRRCMQRFGLTNLQSEMQVK